MSNIEIIFTRPYLLLLLIPCLAFTLIPYFLLPKARRRSFRRIASLTARSSGLTLLCLIISGITIIRTSSNQSVAILLDISDSTDNYREEMIDKANDIAQSLRENNCDVSMIAFAKDSHSIVDISDNESFEMKESESDATDIACAIEYAASVLPDGSGKRIILLSDGLQTDNDALESARYLSSLGIRVDAVYYDPLQKLEKEVQLTSFSAPDGGYTNTDLHFIAEIDSTFETTATLVLRDNEEYVTTFACYLEKGSNIFEFDIEPDTKGVHIYTISVHSLIDTSTINNTASTSVNIQGKPSVLIVSDSLSECDIFKMLLLDDYDVTVSTPYKIPKDIQELCDYDEVVLFNVNAASLPDDYYSLLDIYVSKYGRTLLTVGGKNTYSLGNMKDTAYEQLLPVCLDYNKPQEEDSVALMLVIDCSRSMASGNSNGLSLAKEGAIICLDTLNGGDYAGVISFNSEANIECELLSTTDYNKELIKRSISSIQSGAGTSYYSALSKAYDELKYSSAKIKHIIFLSDGQPSDSGFYELASEMHGDGITISTIGLKYYSQVLNNIAYLGGGDYYYASEAEDLPQIMLNDAKLVSDSPLVLRKTNIIINKNNQLVDGFTDQTLPSLNGYIGSTLKESANAYLVSQSGDPIFATITRENGLVASFMSDLSGVWTGEWLFSENGEELTKRFISTTINKQPILSSMNIYVDKKGNNAVLTVESSGREVNGKVTLTVMSDSKTEQLLMTNIAKGLYSATLDTTNVGVYSISAELTDSGEIIDFVNAKFAVDYKKEYDVFDDSGSTVLSQITRASGGEVFNPNEDYSGLINALPKTVRYATELIVPLGIIAAFLLICDIAMRKLSLKDVKEFFSRFSNK